MSSKLISVGILLLTTLTLWILEYKLLLGNSNHLSLDLPYIYNIDDTQTEYLNLIFQIGFNKCGTKSLYELFEANGIASLHAGHLEMPERWKNNDMLLDDYVNKTKVFTDFGVTSLYLWWDDIYLYDCIRKHLNDTFLRLAICGYYFPLLDKQYKHSKFILNIRPVNHWIYSRFFCQHCAKRFGYYLHKEKKFQLADIVRQWKYVWYMYICDVINYFKDRPNDLLIFDIEKDNVVKVVEFVKPLNITNVDVYNNKTHETNIASHMVKSGRKRSNGQWKPTLILWNELQKQFGFLLNGSTRDDLLELCSIHPTGALHSKILSILEQ